MGWAVHESDANTRRRGFRSRLALVAALLVALTSGVYWWRTQRPVRPAVAKVAPIPTVSAAPSTIADPVSPQRTVLLDPTPRPEAKDWIRARPAFASSRKAAERGGVEPCATQEVDGSAFEPWARLSRGQLLVPRQGAVDDSGKFSLVVHLHGHEPARRELIESGQNFVLYAITLGPSEGYAPLFAARGLDRMVSEIEAVLSAKAGKAVRAGHLALSAWSAGFVGIGAALAQPDGQKIEAAILIDGLHAPRGDRSAFTAQLKPFVDYAARAAQGEGFLFVSHSSIDPPDFASTTECAHYLISTQGAKPQAVRRSDPFGLELVEYFTRGDFHVRGYTGNDKADHCAQLVLLRDAYAALGRRWRRG
jgi:hypothetical protein